MLQHLREALLDKLEEQRDSESSCVIKWSDTNKLEIIPQSSIRLSAGETVRLNVTYTVLIDRQRRTGTVVATGTKRECELALYRLTPHHSRRQETSSTAPVSELLDDLILMKILAKLIQRTQKGTGEESAEDVHDVQCSSCGIKPISHTDRYRCIECPSTPGYELCGGCFEKRRGTDRHRLGHAMIHFKIPREFLGISIDDLHPDLSLNQLKHCPKLQNERHEGVTCDGDCGRKSFTGLRFKCDTCPHYNLCQRCALEKRVLTKNHQHDHPIILTSNRVMPQIDTDDIQMGDVLGRGAFGYVCKATWLSKNRHVACKVIEVSGVSTTSKQLQQSFLQELAAYRELSGPYILRTFGYATQELPGKQMRGTTTQFMILMELMSEGSLQNVLESEPDKISLRRKLTMSRQIASGMRRIHEHGMIHRDIRPDNILVNEKYIAKIGDMGIARVLDPNGQQTQIGCTQFMPPEFFDDSKGPIKCDEKLDIYTYGLTLNQMFTETMHDFRFGSPLPVVTLRKESVVFFDEIISPCLEKDPKRRPTALEIEGTLTMYEQAFGETMLTDQYIRMGTKEKDRSFIQFYLNNRSRIQRFLRAQLPSQLPREIPVQSSQSKRSTPLRAAPSDTPLEDACRVN